MKAVMRVRFFILLVAVLALTFISAASASYSGHDSKKSETPATPRAGADYAPVAASDAGASRRLAAAGFEPLAAVFQAQPESITVSLGACGGAAATTVSLGQIICARLSDAPAERSTR